MRWRIQSSIIGTCLALGSLGISPASGHPTDSSFNNLGRTGLDSAVGFSPYDSVPYLAYPRTTARRLNAFIPTLYNATDLSPDLIAPRPSPVLQHDRHPLALDHDGNLFKQQQPTNLTKRQALDQTIAPFPPSECKPR